ncbi:hypothetical protein Hanom_Chr10g00965741 [Helianthus anomalus]
MQHDLIKIPKWVSKKWLDLNKKNQNFEKGKKGNDHLKILEQPKNQQWRTLATPRRYT